MELTPQLEPTSLSRSLIVKEIFCIHSFWYSSTFRFLGEKHEPMELVYVQSGSVVVSTHSYSAILKPGELIIHKPWDFHQIRANDQQARVLIFSFSLSRRGNQDVLCDRVFTTTDLDKVYLNTIYHKGYPLVAGKNGQGKSATIPNSLDYQIVKNSFELLLLDLLGQKDKKEVDTPNDEKMEKSPVVAKIVTFLEENVYKKLTLKAISMGVGYSVPHISSVFREEMGSSIIDYFINLKIQKAKELIAQNELPIKSISDMLSYETVQYFTTQFKKVTGLTPADFRSQINTDNAYLDIHFDKVGQGK